MSWSYRIIRRRDPDGTPSFALHEAYMDSEGRVYAITKEPAVAIGDTPAELYEVLMMQKMSAMKQQGRTILDYDAVPEPGAVEPGGPRADD